MCVFCLFVCVLAFGRDCGLTVCFVCVECGILYGVGLFVCVYCL